MCCPLISLYLLVKVEVISVEEARSFPGSLWDFANEEVKEERRPDGTLRLPRLHAHMTVTVCHYKEGLV